METPEVCKNPRCGHAQALHTVGNGACGACTCPQYLTEAPTIYGIPPSLSVGDHISPMENFPVPPLTPGTLRGYATGGVIGQSILQRRSYTLHKTVNSADMRQPLAGETQLETWLLDQVREWFNPANTSLLKPPPESSKSGSWVLHLRWEPEA